MRLLGVVQLILCLLNLNFCVSQPDEDYSDAGWIFLSDNQYVDTEYHLKNAKNHDSCIDRVENITAVEHGGNVLKSNRIFYNIHGDDAFDMMRYEETFWVETKEKGVPIMDALPLEGSSFCLSGKHYSNSKDLYQHHYFANMTPLADINFDIGTYVNPKDMSKMNLFQPEETNAKGVTHKTYLGTTDFNFFYHPKDVQMRDYLGFGPNTRGTKTTGGYHYFKQDLQFYIKWKEATDTFFHVQRTRLRYADDPGPRVRKLEDYVGSTVTKGDTVPGFRYRPAIPKNQPNSRCKNPYFIEVTEIEVNDVKLHNWLHVTIYVRPENIIKTVSNCATGKMKWIMLEVRDSMGLPIGDFDSELPCEVDSCQCKSAKCRLVHGHKHNAMPCMFTPMRALTQPGLFMYGIDTKLGNDEWFNEVHATWHFAQHSSYFATELHFSALIVESMAMTKFYSGRQTQYRNPRSCKYVDEVENHYNLIPPFTGPGPAPAPPSYCTSVKEFQPFYSWTWDDMLSPELFSTYKDYCALMGSNNIDHPLFSLSHHKNFWEKDNRRLPEYYSWTLQHISQKKRVYGWNAQYTMLRPTLETLGAWDPVHHFHRNKLVDPTHINCHKKINEDYYEYDSSRSLLRSSIPARRNYWKFMRAYELNAKDYSTKAITQVKVSKYAKPKAADDAAGDDSSDFENIYMRIPLTINVTNPMKKIADETITGSHIIKMNRVYFGTLGTKLAYEDEQGVAKLQPNQKGYDQDFAKSSIGKYFAKLHTAEEIALDERCACPAFGPTLDPETGTREITELQGRNAHAVQMLLAWVVLVPIGVFVSRYYKETYSRVYILEEFWWYTTHVMCLGTAFVLMIGGIYSIEVKHIMNRQAFEAWSEEGKAHVIIGSITIILFGLQLICAPFRMWLIPRRVVNIIFHFVIGVMNYLMGSVAVLLSAAMPQSRMSCSAFYIYSIFLGMQVLLYVYMEFQMRYVDRMLALYPPRTYLPSPIIRIFHTNAPLSKLRIYILAVFVFVCWSVFFIIRYGVIELNVASCYRNLGNDYEEDA